MSTCQRCELTVVKGSLGLPVLVDLVYSDCLPVSGHWETRPRGAVNVNVNDEWVLADVALQYKSPMSVS